MILHFLRKEYLLHQSDGKIKTDTSLSQNTGTLVFDDGTDTVSSYLSTGSSAANLPASQILKKASDTSDYTDVRN